VKGDQSITFWSLLSAAPERPGVNDAVLYFVVRRGDQPGFVSAIIVFTLIQATAKTFESIKK
jgi:hypothetical protein